ncbi:MAG: hypothetical protein EZS28_038441 [Streblomastix strix]|uniref:Uncharacterized protein n=1 Tax=Streblomastix strix TaxID=222440 RepID=A0A5J4U7U6_9EUKA|nr:MAG: hypothetical protein EZS28_038441 [Streblomastix strix]
MAAAAVFDWGISIPFRFDQKTLRIAIDEEVAYFNSIPVRLKENRFIGLAWAARAATRYKISIPFRFDQKADTAKNSIITYNISIPFRFDQKYEAASGVASNELSFGCSYVYARISIPFRFDQKHINNMTYRIEADISIPFRFDQKPADIKNYLRDFDFNSIPVRLKVGVGCPRCNALQNFNSIPVRLKVVELHLSVLYCRISIPFRFDQKVDLQRGAAKNNVISIPFRFDQKPAQRMT